MTKIYKIAYSTENTYENPVNEGIFEFMVAPCIDVSQEIRISDLQTSENIPVFYSENHLGFRTIRLRPHKPFSQFKLEYNCELIKYSSTMEKEWNADAQMRYIQSRDFVIDNNYWLQATTLTSLAQQPLNPDFKYTGSSGLLCFLSNLNSSLNGLIEYKPAETTVETTAIEVLNLGKGVCQDFTHLFLAIARANNLACRYVSGYLNQGMNNLGSAMMHAWAEVFIPGPGWVGFDPANNMLTDQQYIKVCHGRDYTDCPPIKGVIQSKGVNDTKHSVQVCEQ